MILQHEVLRISPIIRDFTLVMVAHHIHHMNASNAARRVGANTGRSPGASDSRNESIHFAAVAVLYCRGGGGWPTLVHIIRIMVRFVALACFRIWDAHSRHPVLHWDA